MNSLVFLPEERDSSGKVCISGRRRAVLREYHSLKVGQKLPVAEWGGMRGTGEILQVSNEEIRLVVEVALSPRPRVPGMFVVALSRPQTVKKVARFAAAVGVEALRFFPAKHSEKSYRSSSALSKESLQDQCIRGLEQVGDSLAPRITLHNHISGLEEGCLSDVRTGVVDGFFADTLAVQPVALSTQIHQDSRPFCIAVGPESGWAEEERTLFREAGFTAVSLGERNYRVETALTMLFAQVELLRNMR